MSTTEVMEVTAGHHAAQHGGRSRSITAHILDRPWLVAGVLALIFGMLIAVFTPPFTGADERDHFDRAFQISSGSILTTKQQKVFGAFLPKRLAVQDQEITSASYADPDHTAFLRFLGAPTPDGPTAFLSLANSASYGPGAYAEYVPAIDLGRLLGLSTLGILYLARFFGVAAYAGLLALAVFRLPVHRWILVAGGLVPAALNQGSTVSADGLTMALAFVVVADALCLSKGSTKTRRVLVELAVAVTLLALAKPPYVLLAGLLLIPALRRRGRVRAALGGILGVGAVFAVGWAFYQGSHSLSQDTPGLFLDQPSVRYEFHHIAIHRQTELILTHPWIFLSALGRSLGSAGLSTLQDLFGHLATYEEPWWIVFLALAVLLGSTVVNERIGAARLDRIERACLVGGVALVFLSIYAIAYTNWNAYHAPIIEAVPTRYFLPLLPWLLIGVIPSKIHLAAVERKIDLRLVLSTLLIVVLSVATFSLWHFHYTGPPIFVHR